MKKFLIALVIIILAVYGFFIEPNMLTVKKYFVNDIQLSGLKIVLVGDFHIKPNQQKRLKKLVALINAQNPDIVLSVGDFVAGHEPNMSMPIEDIIIELKNIKTKYGFYTVLGNHDWWIDGNGITEELNKHNIDVLANSHKKIKIKDKNIYIAGVEDLMTRNADLYSALDKVKQPTILLTHSPDVFKHVPKTVNLTLAGHVHGGQVRLPIIGALIVPSKYGNKYSQGLIEENGKKMIVTKGIGNSILPVRFNCVPEINVIVFE